MPFQDRLGLLGQSGLGEVGQGLAEKCSGFLGLLLDPRIHSAVETGLIFGLADF